jgi:class 3 adenylate cyclase/tetratricopeptide (TPR) repeat protein
MRCSKCGSDNPADKKFCGDCGAALASRCPKCGSENPPSKHFCGDCGAPLVPRNATQSAAPSSNTPNIAITAERTPAPTNDERKTVTALFADIRGSTELMEDLDPEEARAIIDPALKLMIEAVGHYDGYIVQSTGDGIFALFGAPVAHEDHPQRALYAALRLQEATRRYSSKLVADGGTPLEARVGINTGEVVVRTLTTADGHAEYTPIGHTANLASRMEAIAPSGSIAITEHTRRLVEGYFQLKSRGPTRVKGLTEPINVYEVVGLGPLHTRLQSAAARGLTKFVGRQREMDALKHAAEQARAGRGQVVGVMADPGVGKSRLFYEFKATSQSGWMVLEALSVSYGKASAYLPVLELLSEYFEISRDDDDRKRRERVLGKVLRLDRTLEDSLPYLYSLHGIVDAGDSLGQMDPPIRRRRTLDAIKRIFLRESVNQLLMVIFEDLHWIDAETQALLNLLVDAIASARILLLVNYRPEYRHEWGSRTHYTQLRLDPLAGESAEEMLSAMLGDEKDLIPLKLLMIQRTDGTPFFMEEMVQVLFEDGVLQRNGLVKLAKPISTVKIPATVQAVLASRIDRLAPAEKELLQTLAVVGREFSLTLVQRVTSRSSDELEQMISYLQLREFINEQPAVGDVEYSFKHALTQEVAYNSILAERRRALHERTGYAIEELYAHQLDKHYSDLARHYLRGDNAAKAVEYARLAAEQEVNRGSYAEGASLIEQALKRVDRLPDENQRLRVELALRGVESMVAVVLYGGPSPQREQIIKRMCELSERSGDLDQVLRGQVSLCSVYFLRGESVLGLELAGQCFKLAESTRDAGLLADLYYTAGNLAFSSGKLKQAVSYQEAAAVYGGRTEHSVSLFGFLRTSAVKTVLAPTLQLLGHVVQSMKTAEEGLREARESGHLSNISFNLVLKAILSFMRREPEILRRHAEEAIALCEGLGFVWLDFGRFLLGVALAELGQLDRAITEMETGIRSVRNIGGTARLQYFIAVLAKSYAEIGQVEKGLTMLNEALAHVERTGEKVDYAEMLRLKGTVLLMRDPGTTAAAERCFRTALEVACAQEAKWWQLRTSVNLAHLLRDTNRLDEARTMLGEIYNWFTEGFDTADLKEAKALLDELGSERP